MFLKGYEADTWDVVNEEDLVSMTDKYHDKDIIAKWIDVYIIPLYHRALGYRLKDPEKLREGSSVTATRLFYYSDATVRTIVDTLSTIIASLLPTIPAFALYCIRSPIIRLCAIFFSTVLFSVVLAVIARPRRIECFGATAAYAAVLVVFIGNIGPPA